jgi:hypothetical protein
MKQYSQRLAAGLLGVLAMAYQPFAAASTTYGFYGVTLNDTSGGSVADGEANLSVEVIDLGFNSSLGFNQVEFKFFNNSTSSSLTDVYFDDGSLLGIASITDSGTGVSFSQFAAPGNLPGANLASPAFQTTAGFSADSNPAVSPNGVTYGEWVAITFNLLSGKTYADTLAALALPNGGGTGDLRIGVHVQSYPGGYSESFINNPVPVPEAETYAMMLAGLGLVGWAARRRKQSC